MNDGRERTLESGPRIEFGRAASEVPTVRKTVAAGVLLLAVVGLGLQCRLFQFGSGLGQDELFSAVNYIEADSVRATISRNDAFNNHIAYSLAARIAEAIWGRSERVLRLPALLFGLLGIVALFGLARSLLGEGLALLAAFLLALSPPHIEVSVAARGYSAMVLLTTVASYLYLGLLRSPRRGAAAMFVAVSVLGIYTHLYSGAVAAVQVLFLAYLGWRRRGAESTPPFGDRRHVRLLVGSFAAVLALTLLLYLPAARAILRDLAGRGRSPFDFRFPWTVAQYLSGTPQAILVAMWIAVSVVGWLSLRESDAWAADYFAALLVVPLTAMWLWIRPFDLYPRFFIYWLPYALILLLSGLRALWSAAATSRPFGAAARIGAVGVFAAVLWSWFGTARRLIPDEGYREASQRALAGAGPSDAICAIGGARSVWRYYIHRPILHPRSIAEFETIAATHPEVRCTYFRARWQDQEQTRLARFLFDHASAIRINDELTVFSYPRR